MEIVWYGEACFRLRGRGVAVVADPYSDEIGMHLPRMTATLVTLSDPQDVRLSARAVRGSPFVIAGPGEYEVDGVFVIGVDTAQATEKPRGTDSASATSSRHTAYLIEFEDLAIGHLGGLDHVLSQEQMELLSDVDILLVPVGGSPTSDGPAVLTGAQAAEVVGLLEPRIVVPMQYKIPGLTVQRATASRFLKELGVEKPEKLESLTVSKTQLPEEMRLVLLEAKQ